MPHSRNIDTFKDNIGSEKYFQVTYSKTCTSYNLLAPPFRLQNYVLKPFKKRKSHPNNMGWMNKICGSGSRYFEVPVEPTKVKFWWKTYLFYSLN